MRSVLADSGITFNADNTNFFFGNTTGGSAQQLLGSGHGDYVLEFRRREARTSPTTPI